MSGGSSNRGRGGGGGGGGSDSSTSSSTSSSFRHTANVMVNQAEQKIKDKFEELTPILTKSQLRNLDQHKYTASGVTLLDPLLQPFWNWLVLQMPLYVAPNLITLVGLAINVLTSTILMIQSPNADQHLPAWSLLLCSLGLIVYQSLDAIDGKQARRTNSSSPLGELFDHGCDAISLVFVTLAFAATLRLGNDPWLMFSLMALSLATFYTAHWQTYVSGSLKFGKVDVTEGQTVVYTIFALTGIFGDALWSWHVPVVGVELRYAPVLIGIAGAAVSIFNNVHMISQGGKGKNGSSVADTSIVFPVFPLLLFLFMSFSIANKSEVVYLDNMCLYWLAFGFVWAKMTIKLIVAHMTKGEINLIDSCLIGPVLLLLNQYFGYIVSEFFVLFVCFVYSAFNLFEYCSKVCYQICTHMNIYLFKIKPPSADSVSSQQQQQPVNPTSHVTTRRQYQQQQQHQH